MEKLIYQSKNDECRIYETEYGFELRYNSIFHGDPCYRYKTLKGAKIAMAIMSKGIYKDIKKPSCSWEIEITEDEAKERYCKYLNVYVSTNERTHWKLPASYEYSSHAPVEDLFYRSIPRNEGEVKFYKG